nr:SDR family oxidoreductase [Petropleomorpha daqingensis]
MVTGGGSGVGRAIALALAEERPVAVLGRRAAPLEETVAEIAGRGGRALAVAVDVTDDTALAAAVARVEAQLGPVDVLVNNAGSGGAPARLSDGDLGPLRSVLAVNLVAPAVLSALVLPGMVARGAGHVLNVTSLQGSRTFPGYVAYGASKAGLMRLTDSLAAELAGTGVVVVDLSPGLVRTDMTAEPELAALLADVPDDEWSPVARVAEKAVALVSGRYDVLAGRFVHAEDDLDALVAALRPEDDDARRLRMTPIAGGDPLFD